MCCIFPFKTQCRVLVLIGTFPAAAANLSRIPHVPFLSPACLHARLGLYVLMCLFLPSGEGQISGRLVSPVSVSDCSLPVDVFHRRCREISLLRELCQHPCVVALHDIQYATTDVLYMVFEYMDQVLTEGVRGAMYLGRCSRSGWKIRFAFEYATGGRQATPTTCRHPAFEHGVKVVEIPTRVCCCSLCSSRYGPWVVLVCRSPWSVVGSKAKSLDRQFQQHLVARCSADGKV